LPLCNERKKKLVFILSVDLAVPYGKHRRRRECTAAQSIAESLRDLSKTVREDDL